MIDSKNVLRLNFPLWQGGDSPSYQVGHGVLAAIAPAPIGPVESILIPLATEQELHKSTGIKSHKAILDILEGARTAVERHAPEGIVTLFGDGLVNLVPVGCLSVLPNTLSSLGLTPIRTS